MLMKSLAFLILDTWDVLITSNESSAQSRPSERQYYDIVGLEEMYYNFLKWKKKEKKTNLALFF